MNHSDSELVETESSTDGYECYSSDVSGQFESKSESSKQSTCQESCSNEDVICGSNLSNDLVEWSLNHSIKHSALDDLLVLLKKHGHDSLPKKAVTLLQTPHKPSLGVVVMGSGQYWYHGILNCLKAYFKPPMSTNNEIAIDFFCRWIFTV